MDKEKIEQQLIGRLKLLGYVLLAFSVLALLWPLLPEFEAEEEALAAEILPELAKPPPLSPYLACAAFAVIGSTCVVLAWRKKNAFDPEDFAR